jgi:putative ABC transport system substrate-binding protein
MTIVIGRREFVAALGAATVALPLAARGQQAAMSRIGVLLAYDVFVIVSDPVGDGIVASLSRPGGNITGFAYAEAALAGKLLGLLTEIAPGITRAAAMFNPDTVAGGGSYYLPPFEAAARSLKVTPIVAPVHNDAEIGTAITSLGREPGGGLVQTDDGDVRS